MNGKDNTVQGMNPGVTHTDGGSSPFFFFGLPGQGKSITRTRAVPDAMAALQVFLDGRGTEMSSLDEGGRK